MPYADAAGTGVTFRVWAPNATKITVFGSFNGWDTNSLPLVREVPLTNGIWSIDVPAARPGDAFKYSINDQIRRRDPRAREVVHSGEAPAVVYDPNSYWWQTPEFIPPPLEELVLYEMHIGTFNHPNPSESGVGTFYDAIERLDEIALLGINAIQLMPVAEFAGNNSWGYNPSDPFAVESAYGGPDGFKAFVDASHARGLAVILDVVHNHYGPSDLENSLWEFDGWSGTSGGGIYFNQDSVRALTPWGPRPDYSRPQVRTYIKDNIRMWLEEYRVDGFRWDATLFIRYATNFTAIADGASLLQDISDMMAMEFPEKIHVAEDLLGDERVTAALSETGGLGFNSQWDRSFHVDVVAQLTNNAGPNVHTLANAMNYTGGARRVVYTESHDEVGYLNEDEGANRITTRVAPSDPFGWVSRKKTTLGATLAITAPGVPMIFQGQEMLENDLFSTTVGVDWSKTNTYSGIVRLYQDIIGARRNRGGVTAGLRGDFSSATVTNNGTLLLVHRGIAGEPADDVFIVANFSTNYVEGYWIDFPADGTWYVHFNSQHPDYSPDFSHWGSTNVFVYPDLRGNPYVAPLSVLILSRHPPAPLDHDRDGMPDAWEIANGLDPYNPRDAWLNPDHDAYTNIEEFRAGTNPNVWNLPASAYSFMAIPGSFNGWNTSADEMVLIADGLWQRDLSITNTTIEFKFAADDGWDANWGIIGQTRFSPPLTWATEPQSEANIVLSNLTAGIYRFRFDENRQRFTVRQVPFADSDNDGMPDDWEIANGLDPFSNHDGWLSVDGDLYTNRDKYHYGLTPGEWAPPLTDYQSMGVIFDFNGWNPAQMNMTQSLDAHYTWVVVTNILRPQGMAFKFAANGSWVDSWGDWDPAGAEWPLSGVADRDGDDIVIQNAMAGAYRFTFNERTGVYSLELDDEEWSPPVYGSMAVAENFNAWSQTPNMTSNGLHQWSFTTPLNRTQPIEFKFVANNNWDINWGRTINHPNNFPISGVAELLADDNITVAGPFLGIYTFTFNTATYSYTMTRDGPLPAAYGTMSVAGSFNGWNTTPNMTLNDENEWFADFYHQQGGQLEFKFVTSNNWDVANWGDTKTHTTNSPATGTATLSAANIRLPGPFAGTYRYTFNDRTRAYRVERLPSLEMGSGEWVNAGTGLVLRWASEEGRTYDVQQALSLVPGGFSSLISNLPATPPMNVWTASVPVGVPSSFYRIRQNE